MKKTQSRSTSKKASWAVRSEGDVAKSGKIVAKKASASAIRKSLGIKKTEAKVGSAAIRVASAPAGKKGASLKPSAPARSAASRPTVATSR